MNKTLLVQQTQGALKHKLSREHCRLALDAVFEMICEGLQRDGRVQIPKFGVFELRERKSRSGRHPATGEKILFAGGPTVGFRPSNELKMRMVKTALAELKNSQ